MESLFPPSFRNQAKYKPQKNDDRSKLLCESWIQLHKCQPLVRCCPFSDPISKIRFNRAVYVIAQTYAKIRSKTMEVSVILEDEISLRALFQLAYVLVSFHFSFFSFKAYEDLLKDYILEIAKNPTLENIKRETSIMSIAESITKNLDLGKSKPGEFDPLFKEVFKLARDPVQSEKRKKRVAALNVLYDGDIILPKKKRKICDKVASSSVIRLEFPAQECANVILKGLDMLEHNSRHYTAQTLEILRGTLSEAEKFAQLQKSESEPESELTKLKWVLQIMKHMEFKDHVFSSSNEFVVPKLAETEVEKDGARPLNKCDPELLFKNMMRKSMIHQHLQISTCVPSLIAEVEISQLINSVGDSLKQLKNEMQLKLEEFSGKIEFCMMVYEGTKVEEKLKRFYEKKSQILLDLGLDLRFCCSFCNNLSSEMATKFQNLLDELEVV